MDKNVKITLKTTQTQEKDTHEMKFSYEGMYFQKGNHYYVMYEEPVEGSREVIKNRLKFSDDFVEVVKKGALSSTMYFEKGKNYPAEYHTPFGIIHLQMETYHYQMEWFGEDKVRLAIHYKMSNEQGQIADCKMEIQMETCV